MENKKTIYIIGALLFFALLIYLATDSDKKDDKDINSKTDSEQVVNKNNADENKKESDSKKDTNENKKNSETENKTKVQPVSKEVYKSTDADNVKEKKAKDMNPKELLDKLSIYIEQLDTLTEDKANGKISNEDFDIQMKDLQKRVVEISEMIPEK